MVESLPFYAPMAAGNHLSILSFNNNPPPDSLGEVLVKHTELSSDDVVIRWTQELDLIFEATLGQLREYVAKP